MFTRVYLCWPPFTRAYFTYVYPFSLVFTKVFSFLWEPPERREGFWNYRKGHSPTIVAAPIQKLWPLNWRMSSPCTSNAWWTASTNLCEKGEPSWNWNRWPGADPLTAKKDSSHLTGQIRPSKWPRKICTPTPNVSVLLWRKWSETKDGEECESTETSLAVSEGSSWAEPVNIPPQRKPKNLYSRLLTTSLHPVMLAAVNMSKTRASKSVELQGDAGASSDQVKLCKCPSIHTLVAVGRRRLSQRNPASSGRNECHLDKPESTHKKGYVQLEMLQTEPGAVQK